MAMHSGQIPTPGQTNSLQIPTLTYFPHEQNIDRCIISYVGKVEAEENHLFVITSDPCPLKHSPPELLSNIKGSHDLDYIES